MSEWVTNHGLRTKAVLSVGDVLIAITHEQDGPGLLVWVEVPE